MASWSPHFQTLRVSDVGAGQRAEMGILRSVAFVYSVIPDTFLQTGHLRTERRREHSQAEVPEKLKGLLPRGLAAFGTVWALS